jgi:hypothetical protein
VPSGASAIPSGRSRLDDCGLSFGGHSDRSGGGLQTGYDWSLDHLVGAREHQLRNLEAEHAGSLEVYDELELGWLLDR